MVRKIKNPIAIFLLFPILLFAQWTPVDYQKWQNPANPQEFQARIGGEMANYQVNANTWSPIENLFTVIGDSMAIAHNAILKTTVRLNGESEITITWHGEDYVITQKPIKLIWVNSQTQNWIDVFPTGSWSVPSVVGNRIRWTNVFPAVDYAVEKNNGTVGHGVIFKPAFLDSAVTLYNLRPDSQYIYLGNVFKYLLSDNIDSALFAVGNNRGRILKRLGRYLFELTDQRLRFPGSDTTFVPVYTKWRIINDEIYCAEFVKMSHVKQIHQAYPNAIIWHNDEVSIGASDIEDTYISSSSPTNNYGALTIFYSHLNLPGLIRVMNVASNLGENATISAAVCSLYSNSGVYNATIAGYRIFKPWIEGTQTGSPSSGGCNWTFWDAINAYNWTTAGCNSADDAGSDNSGDGTGADRKETAEGSATWTGINQWQSISISSGLAQDWYDGDANEEGLYLKPTSNWSSFKSTEHATASIRPRFSFTYSTGAPPAAARRDQLIIIN